MRKLLTAALLLAVATTVSSFTLAPFNIPTTATEGYEIGWMTYETDALEAPVPENKLYTDSEASWPTAAFDGIFSDKIMVRTLAASATTTGGTIQSTVELGDDYFLVGIWHDDREVNKPAWLATDGYVDCGQDALIDGSNSASLWCTEKTGTVAFKGNCKAGGCDNIGSAMYTAVLIPYWQAGDIAPGPPGDPGTVGFTTSSAQETEQVTGFVYVERQGGTSGQCDIDIEIVTDTSPGSTLTTTSLQWADTEAGQKAVQFTGADVTGNDILTLGLTNPIVCAEGIQDTIDITIIDDDITPSAQTHYVNPGVTCNDSWDGEAKTDQGGGNGPWCSSSKGSSVQSVGGGHVDIVLVGPHSERRVRHDPMTFGFSGDDADHMIRYTCEDGDWIVQGPSSGSNLLYGLDDGGHDYVGWINGSGCQIKVHGECVPTKEGGPTGCNADKIALINGDNNIIEGFSQNTNGWDGITNFGHMNIIRWDMDGHGNPWYDHPTNGCCDDFGNAITRPAVRNDKGVLQYPDFPCPGATCGTSKQLLENFDVRRGGHDILQIYGGQGIAREGFANSDWGGVATYSSTIPDGSRISSMTNDTRNYFWIGLALVTNGLSTGQSASASSMYKHEGDSNILARSYIIDSFERAIKCATGSHQKGWDVKTVDSMILHSVIYDTQSAALWCSDQDITKDFRPPSVIGSILEFIAQDPHDSSERDDVIYWMDCSSSSPHDFRTWDPIWKFAYNVVSQDGEAARIAIDTTCGGAGERLLTWYQDPANGYDTWIHDNQVGSANFVDPSKPYPDSLAETRADFATQAGSIARFSVNGIDVCATHVTSTGSGTTMRVDNPRPFTDGYGFPNATTGNYTGGYTIQNRDTGWDNNIITSVDYDTGDIGLTTSRSWTAGDCVDWGGIDDIGASQS